MTGPRVSVVMPVYNGERYIAESVSSILHQTLKDFELLIIDDGSTDRSFEIAHSFQQADPRIRVLQNSRNEGLILTRNRGMKEARGEFVAMLDADDIARPERLERQVAFLEGHPEIACVGSWASFIDEKGEPTGTYWREKHRPVDFPSVLLFNNCFAQSTITGRREIFLQEPYRQEFPLAEDFDLWVRIARRAPMAVLPRVLVHYRLHAQSTSSSMRGSLADSVTRIFESQIASLGIAPDKRELAIHRVLSECAFTPSRSLVRECEEWLRKIKAANERSGLFARESLARILSEKWLLVCGNSRLSLWALGTYFRSPLSTIQRVSVIDTMKLLVKCLTGITGAPTARPLNDSKTP